MDHYRLLYPPHSQCVSITYASAVIACAHPPIDPSAHDLFSQLETRRGRMFFARHKLKTQFQRLDVVQALLGCSCPDCSRKHRVLLTAKTNEDTVRNDAWMLLALLVYLGKLHFIHDWVNHPITDTNLGDALGHDFLRKIIPDALERKLFKGAYERAREAFNPVIFRLEPGGSYTRNEYPDQKRFPFLSKEQYHRQGCFGQITKVEISRHDLHETIVSKMEGYPHACVGLSKEERKYVFAIKSVKEKKSTEDSIEMEVAILQLVSKLQNRATENIITLLASYHWQGSIHFLFPFVDGDLQDLLGGSFKPDASRPLNLGATDVLADHWLWQQIIGVAHALHQIHTGLIAPTPGMNGKIIAFHFDLKPANILVTISGVLKITDFGQSVIDIVDENGPGLNTQFAGDPEYGDPESPYELSDSLGQVGQNCDIWSLACIMTEILVFLRGSRDNQLGWQALAEFNDHRRQTHGKTFYDGNAQVKACVRKAIEDVPSDFVGNSRYHQYLRGLRNILLGSSVQDGASNEVPMLGMFAAKRSGRATSADVVKQFEDLEAEYRNADDEPRDPLVRYLEMQPLYDGDGFHEVGWMRDTSVASFLELPDIAVRRIVRGRHEYAHKDCRLQIFYRDTKASPPAIHIRWAWQADTGRRASSNQQHQMPSNDDSRRILLSNKPIWHIIPECMYQDTKAFQCCIFQDGEVLMFEFNEKCHALNFQETLLRFEQAESLQCGIQRANVKWQPQRDTIIGESRIHFWKEMKPKYLRPTAFRQRRTESIDTTTSSSSRSASDESMKVRPPNMMVLFEPKRPVLALRLRQNQFWFRRSGASTVRVVRRADRDSFLAIATQRARPPYADFNMGQFKAPALPLLNSLYQKENYFKVKEMVFQFTDVRDVEVVAGATAGEGGDWSELGQRRGTFV